MNKDSHLLSLSIFSLSLILIYVKSNVLFFAGLGFITGALAVIVEVGNYFD